MTVNRFAVIWGILAYHSWCIFIIIHNVLYVYSIQYSSFAILRTAIQRESNEIRVMYMWYANRAKKESAPHSGHNVVSSKPHTTYHFYYFYFEFNFSWFWRVVQRERTFVGSFGIYLIFNQSFFLHCISGNDHHTLKENNCNFLLCWNSIRTSFFFWKKYRITRRNRI